MALTLDSTLATAQDSQSRHPLMEIISSQNIADIPFAGSFLDSEIFNEHGINSIAHSSGRLVGAYCYAPVSGIANRGIRYVYTDVDRTTFTTVSIPLYTAVSYTIKGVSICEMTGGNIGLIYLVNDADNNIYRLLRRIITVTGTAVSNAEIANWSNSTFTSDPWVQTLGVNSYLLIYGKKSGDNYYIYKRTSADFLTWSAESVLSIGGLTSTFRLANPSILKISTDAYWLWFDVLESTSGGSELVNVYYSTTTDWSTMANAVKFTNYSTYSESGAHPVAVQKTANQMHLLYTKIAGVLYANDTASGWPTGDNSAELSWDSVNRKLYVINRSAPPNYVFQCVVRIDVDTWTVDKYWDTTTTPGFDAAIGVSFGFAQHDGANIVIWNDAPVTRIIEHLDGEANSITSYHLHNVDGVFTGGNVLGIPQQGYIYCDTSACYYMGKPYIDITNHRIWLTFTSWNNATIKIGYLDLNETPVYSAQTGNDSYTFHAFWTSTSGQFNTAGETQGIGRDGYGGIYIDNTNNLLIMTGGKVGSPVFGFFGTIDLTSGVMIQEVHIAGNGIYQPLAYNGKVYAGHGPNGVATSLAEIDIATGVITLLTLNYVDGTAVSMSRPTYLQDGKIAFIHEPYGLIVYDTVNRSYVIFSNDTIPGFTGDHINPSWQSQIAYDDTNDLIMFGNRFYTYSGVYMFSVHGYIQQTFYSIGTYSGSAWSFTAPVTMMRGFADYDSSPVVEPGSISSMYVFWTNRNNDSKLAIKWDKDGSSMDVSGYVASEVAEQKSISGSLATLSFEVSHGHLFNLYNSASTLKAVFKKGRKLTLRWGEKVSGTDYWQNSGTYYVTEASLIFERGQYPIMKVSAEDRRCFWVNSHVYATEAYNNTPKEIIESILTDLADLSAGDMDIPDISAVLIDYQWMETTLDEILNKVCERFGYYFRFDCDGKASARLISNVAAIDHTYTDNTKLLNYSPDDSYSNFTNRVTVKGQKLDFTDVIYPEERVGAISGTLGWWGCKADNVVWYSTDKSRRVINPRLVVIESATSIAMAMAGSVKEWLEDCGEDDDHKFCTIHTEAPNMTAPLLANIAAYLEAAAYVDGVTAAGFIAEAGCTISIGRLVEAASGMAVMMILGSVANYQLEVWGQPLGKIRESIQGQANDLDHQTEINAIVEQVVEDPLCFTFSDCMDVANFELMVVQMQRRRVKYKKITHLQDEDGDTIRVVHPYSGQNIDLFITDLKRTFKKTEVNGQGYFLDEIEGWESLAVNV